MRRSAKGRKNLQRRLLSARRPPLRGAGWVEPCQFQQGHAARIFFTRSLVEYHHFPGLLLLNHAAPQIGRSGTLGYDLDVIRRLDNLHSLSSGADSSGLSLPDKRLLHSHPGDANVKNMLKSGICLWNTGLVQHR